MTLDDEELDAALRGLGPPADAAPQTEVAVMLRRATALSRLGRRGFRPALPGLVAITMMVAATMVLPKGVPEVADRCCSATGPDLAVSRTVTIPAPQLAASAVSHPASGPLASAPRPRSADPEPSAREPARDSAPPAGGRSAATASTMPPSADRSGPPSKIAAATPPTVAVSADRAAHMAAKTRPAGDGTAAAGVPDAIAARSQRAGASIARRAGRPDWRVGAAFGVGAAHQFGGPAAIPTEAASADLRILAIGPGPGRLRVALEGGLRGSLLAGAARRRGEIAFRAGGGPAWELGRARIGAIWEIGARLIPPEPGADSLDDPGVGWLYVTTGPVLEAMFGRADRPNLVLRLSADGAPLDVDGTGRSKLVVRVGAGLGLDLGMP